jgi:hypothetical protein
MGMSDTSRFRERTKIPDPVEIRLRAAQRDNVRSLKDSSRPSRCRHQRRHRSN